MSDKKEIGQDVHRPALSFTPTLSSAPTLINPFFQMINSALEKGMDLKFIDKIVEMQHQHDGREARKEFIAAMSSLKSEIGAIVPTGKVFFYLKNRDLPPTDYKHVTWGDLSKSLDKHLGRNNLSYSFETKQYEENAKITVTCTVSHSSGHSEQSLMTGFADLSGNKNGMQQIASTKTYLKRYTLCDVFGLGEGHDNDGESEDNQNQISNESSQVEPTPVVDNGFSDETFNKNLPAWTETIRKKGAEKTIAFLTEEKGKVLTPIQISALYKVEKNL